MKEKEKNREMGKKARLWRGKKDMIMMMIAAGGG